MTCDPTGDALQGTALLPTAPRPIVVTGPTVPQTRSHPLWQRGGLRSLSGW